MYLNTMPSIFITRQYVMLSTGCLDKYVVKIAKCSPDFHSTPPQPPTPAQNLEMFLDFRFGHLKSPLSLTIGPSHGELDFNIADTLLSVCTRKSPSHFIKSGLVAGPERDNCILTNSIYLCLNHTNKQPIEDNMAKMFTLFHGDLISGPTMKKVTRRKISTRVQGVLTMGKCGAFTKL